MNEPQIPGEYGMSREPAGGEPEPAADAAPAAETRGSKPEHVPTSPDLCADRVVSRPLADLMARAGGEDRIGVTIELATAHPEGLRGAAEAVRRLIAAIAPDTAVRTSRESRYVSAALTAAQIRNLVAADASEGLSETGQEPAPGSRRGAGSAPARPQPEPVPDSRATPRRPAPRWAIYRIWPNFETRGLIHRTAITTKCEAAQRSFAAVGAGIVWAVLDSGIQVDHPHFTTHANLTLPPTLAHKSFLDGGTDADPLADTCGHGTHVAGILAGEQVATPTSPIIAATWYQDDSGNRLVNALALDRISGMAPHCRLLSCKVLRSDGSGDVAALLDALEYVQQLNQGGRELNVHGVNLSVGYPFDPSWFGTGLTPVCREVDRLVRSGVVVVVAAGNTGYGYALADDAKQRMRLGFEMTINDPGNTESAITVGSTSIQPHLTGISYFSSKGPTGDGRLKPDLVAPGERVVSAGAGDLLLKAQKQVPGASYVEDSGTSMSAPHVSGVAAGFLSIHTEYIGRPDDVKRILLATAGDLGRQVTFQGRGLVDAMRAIQSV